eukprot:g40020.t1
MKAANSQMGRSKNKPGSSEQSERLLEPMGSPSPSTIEETSVSEMDTADDMPRHLCHQENEFLPRHSGHKSTKIEKEKRELAKQYGMVRIEVTGGEIAEEMEKERRMFQLQMCEEQIASEKPDKEMLQLTDCSGFLVIAGE